MSNNCLLLWLLLIVLVNDCLGSVVGVKLKLFEFVCWIGVVFCFEYCL